MKTPNPRSRLHSLIPAMAVAAAAVGSPIPAAAQSCPGDYDLDGRVGAADLGRMLGDWGVGDPRFDLNGDGLVDSADLGLLVAVWGDCPDVEYCHASSAMVLASMSGGSIDAGEAGAVTVLPDRPAESEGRICGAEAFQGRSAFGSLVTYQYYEVEGFTPFDIYYAIENGCCIVVDGEPYAAYTTWELEVQSGCIEFPASDQTTFGVVDVRFIYTVNLPIWNPPADALPGDIAQWNQVMELLEEHELQHVAIGEAFRHQLLMEAVGIAGTGFTRSVPGSECPLYYGDGAIPGTDVEASTFESDAVQWLLDGPTFNTMMQLHRQFDADSDHGDVWAPLGE